MRLAPVCRCCSNLRMRNARGCCNPSLAKRQIVRIMPTLQRSGAGATCWSHVHVHVLHLCGCSVLCPSELVLCPVCSTEMLAAVRRCCSNRFVQRTFSCCISNGKCCTFGPIAESRRWWLCAGLATVCMRTEMGGQRCNAFCNGQDEVRPSGELF